MPCLHLLLLSVWPAAFGPAIAAAKDVPSANAPVPAETAAAAQARHAQVARRRKGPHVLCHRGASQFAVENTLEAYRASFELGADGNEIDIRATRDGVLVCFHDDMLDHLLVAYGDVSDFTWQELRRFPFRDPGPYGKACRIPTLVEVFELHRRYNGLLHLDVKKPGLETAIARLLDRLDMWDHVAYCNDYNSTTLLRNPRLQRCRYKAPGLYSDRSEVDPQAIGEALKKPGEGLLVDDPRGVLVALHRPLGKISKAPVAPAPPPPEAPALPAATVARLIATLRDAGDWDRVAESPKERAAAAQRILARARAAEALLVLRTSSKEAFAALAERVRHRSLHKNWRYHGVDGAAALGALILLHAPDAVELARFTLWHNDPALAAVADPRWKNPTSWTDFRVQMVIWPALAKAPGAATEKLCRDYLALSDEQARQLGPPQVQEAARTLLEVSPRTETAVELLRDRRREVRGQAILGCLRHGSAPWARAALAKEAPYALTYRVPD
jgi:hypothetical protein